jgi:hypothetical protein
MNSMVGAHVLSPGAGLGHASSHNNYCDAVEDVHGAWCNGCYLVKSVCQVVSVKLSIQACNCIGDHALPAGGTLHSFSCFSHTAGWFSNNQCLVMQRWI